MADKKKKKKVVYYDDGRTIADMSNLYGIKKADEADGEPEYKGNPNLFGGYRPGHTPKDWAKTYWNSVKTMFLPMLATLGIIGGAFLVLWILLEIAS
ncbi:MAG: hypothetical protein IJX97_03095 [Clostridia bacterium]|nr:hypothetical protein [Clostridia bacterium]